MDPINAAIEFLESQPSNARSSYTKVAAQFGVSRHTLARQHQGKCVSHATKSLNQQLLSQQQELDLVNYIRQLTEEGLPPSRRILQNFCISIAKKPASLRWVSRFLQRHKDELKSHHGKGKDRLRHKADSLYKYEYWFQDLARILLKYHVRPGDIYNMDEKGFHLGRGEGTYRVFSRDSWERGGRRQPIQDGSREWLTVIAAVCADGSVVPPTILYASPSGNIQERWVKDIEYEDDQVMVGSTETGWSNNKVGVAWLEDVFDRYTKDKAPLRHRLFLLDGHSSHQTPEFMEYCRPRRILPLLLPPHSTHTLQPLDVGLFSPLSSAYSHQLAEYLAKTQGLLSLKKGDFYHLFKQAWDTSFTVTNVQSSFATTGIVPWEPEEVLKKFRTTTPEPPEYPTAINTVNRRTVGTLMANTITPDSHEAAVVKETLLSLQAQQAILEHENNGLRYALGRKQRDYKTPINALDVQTNRDNHARALLLSPRTVRHAIDRRIENEREIEEDKRNRLQKKEFKAEAKLIAEEQARIKREERVKERERKKKEKAAKAAQEIKDCEARNALKAIQTSQSSKRKASKPAAKQQLKKRRVGGARGGAMAEVPAPAPPPTLTRRGRTVNIPAKFR